jgi:CubicO group peptidase (beta-lactamase class C family)
MRRPGLALAVALAAVAGLAQPARPAQQPAEPARPDLQRILDGLVTGSGRVAPGATAYVAGPHGVWVGAAGVANVKTGERMKPDARMRLESVSKLWTATLVLQLVGEGKLGLSDTVSHRLPGLLPYGNRIDLRELLDHTSGMVDTNDFTNAPERWLAKIKSTALRTKVTAISKRLAADPSYEFSPKVWVEIAAALPLLAKPGTTYHYSNIGYIVAGLAAEKAGGASLATLVRRRIAGRLGLKTAAYDPHSTISGPHAHGYRIAKDGSLTDTTRVTVGLGANGGIVSDAADEARFLVSLMQGKLLKPAQLAALETPSRWSNYGLGTGIDESGCAGVAYGHNGGGDGFTTSVFVSGDGRRVAVLLANGRTADDHGDALVHAAMNALYCAA